MIAEIDIWRAACLMVRWYGETAQEEGARRANELTAVGDDAGVAVWHRINDAIEQLANMTPLVQSTKGWLTRTQWQFGISRLLASLRCGCRRLLGLPATTHYWQKKCPLPPIRRCRGAFLRHRLRGRRLLRETSF